MAVDLTQVAHVDAEPGELPGHDGRLGHPPGARGRARRRLPGRGDRGARARRLRGHRPRDGRRRELQQRLGGARQAGLGLPLPPRGGPPHRRLGRLRRSCGRSARASRAGSPATRSSCTATRPPTRTPRSTASTRSPRPRSRSGATRRPGARSPSSRKVQAQQLLPKPQAPRLGGGRLLRADVLHRLPHADRPRAAAGRPPRAHLGRRRRPRRLRHPAVPRRRRRVRRRRLLAREKGELVEQLGAARLHRPQRVRGHDAPRRRDARGGEGALQGVARASPSASRRCSATRPTSSSSTSARRRSRPRCFVVKPFGKVVICGATSGYNLDFDVRYLWMRQKQIIGSHFANAWECNQANELIEAGQDPARAVAYDGLRPGRRGPPAHAREQAPRQDRHPRRRRPKRARASTADGPGAIRAEVGA